MTDLVWFEAFPPAGHGLSDVTAVLRTLSHRPRQGITKRTPLVVFELWLSKGAVRWLVGMERELSFTLPHQLSEQLSGLSLVPCRQPLRPTPTAATGLRLEGLLYPLRTDMASNVGLGLMQLAERLGPSQSAVVQWVVGPSTPRRTPPTEFRLSEALGLRPPAQTSAPERRAWGVKVQEPVFAVQGRLGATARTRRTAGAIVRQLHQALSLADGSQAQLKPNGGAKRTPEQLIAVSGARRRWAGIANAAELALLIGWPVDGVAVPGHVGPSLSPAPAKLLAPDGAPPASGRTLGQSLHPADGGQTVIMPPRASTSHLHITGPTGSGKSTLLTKLVLADADAGRGVLVLEPKGDLIDDVLARLPRERHDDVVIIEPSEHGPVVGLNPLAGPSAQAERRADELLDLFRSLFGAAIGPRSADVLLHSLITAARFPDGTLTDVTTLLTNPAFRRRMLAQTNDPLVLAPFWAWFDGLSDGERGQVVAPVLNKLRGFTTRASIRRLLGQPTPRFDLADLLTKRKIVLVNLNRGLIGPGTARLLGSLFLTQLWQAIQRRSAVPVRRREAVTVVIDEWQDFVGALDFGEVLAQSRGLGVGFVLAHQHLGQLGQRLRSAVLANTRSRISFRPAQRDAQTLAAALGGGLTGADLERLAAYQAVARLLVDNTPSHPFAIQTLPLPDATNDVDALRSSSQRRYGTDGLEIDQTLAARWQGGDSSNSAPIGVTRRRP